MQKKFSGLVQFCVLSLIGCVIVALLAAPNLLLGWQDRRTVQVSVIVRETDAMLYTNLRMGMEQAAYDLGCELRFLLPEENNQHTAQASLLLREVEAGTDAIVMQAADTARMRVETKQLEIPVIGLESNLSNRCIAPDDTALGQALAKACGVPDGTVLLLNSVPHSEAVQQRLAACAAVLQAAGVAVQTVAVPAQEIALAQHLAQSEAVAVIAFEASATQALASEAHSEVSFYGVGNSETLVMALENGALTALAASSDYAAGYLAVQAACEAAQEKSANLYPAVAFRMIRKADIYEESNQKLLFPVVS